MKMRSKTQWLRAGGWALGSAVLACACVFAGFFLGRSTPAEPWALTVSRASQGGASLIKTFPGPDGLTGLVIEGKQSHGRKIGWGIDGATRLIVVGHMIDTTGRDATEQAYKTEVAGARNGAGDKSAGATSAGHDQTNDTHARSAAEPQQANSSQTGLTKKQIWRGVNAASAITLGAQHPNGTLFVFADPNCPYCHDLYQRLTRKRKALTTSKTGIRWIPVATLSDTSAGRAAALLNGGAAALAKNEAGYNLAKEEGAIAPMQDTALQRIVLANTALMLHDGAKAVTPTLVWRDKKGVHVYAGEPGNDALQSILESLNDGGAHDNEG